jgi:DNA-binding transcriptional LysR family regulator
MLLAGLGVGQLYETTVRGLLASGALVAVLEDWETPSAPVSVVYPPAKRGNQRVRPRGRPTCMFARGLASIGVPLANGF